MKTNRQWYPYPDFGLYYRLVDDELYQCPMNSDGSRADRSTLVDFVFGIEPAVMTVLKAIKEDLEFKD